MLVIFRRTEGSSCDGIGVQVGATMQQWERGEEVMVRDCHFEAENRREQGVVEGWSKMCSAVVGAEYFGGGKWPVDSSDRER